MKALEYISAVCAVLIAIALIACMIPFAVVVGLCELISDKIGGATAGIRDRIARLGGGDVG